MTQRMENVHYTRLIPNPLNIRKTIAHDAAFLDLAASIEQHGVAQPLVGIPLPDGNVLLVCGHVRSACIRHLVDSSQLPADHPHCSPPVVLEPGMPVERQLALMAVENLHRVPINPVDEGLFYQSLQAQGWTRNAISNRLNVSGPRVANRLAIVAHPSAIRSLFGESRLPLLAAEPLATIANEKDRQKLAQMLAGRNLKLDRIRTLCERVATHGLEPSASERPAHAARPPRPRAPTVPERRIGMAMVQAAILETCTHCDVAQVLRLPAATTGQAVNESAGVTCAQCSVRDLTSACEMCPLVDFLKHLEAADGR